MSKSRNFKLTIVNGVLLECSSLELLHDITMQSRHMTNKLSPVSYFIDETATTFDRAQTWRYLLHEVLQSSMLW
jgi:hypothetical protein